MPLTPEQLSSVRNFVTGLTVSNLPTRLHSTRPNGWWSISTAPPCGKFKWSFSGLEKKRNAFKSIIKSTWILIGWRIPALFTALLTWNRSTSNTKIRVRYCEISNSIIINKQFHKILLKFIGVICQEWPLITWWVPWIVKITFLKQKLILFFCSIGKFLWARGSALWNFGLSSAVTV